MDKMRIWNAMRRPPVKALKRIGGGKLSGFTNIDPLWRDQAITELFGPQGEGWFVELINVRTADGPYCEAMVFMDINFYYKLDNGEWSKPCFGTGGSGLINTEKGKLVGNDEAFKMAYTDALSVALKGLGCGADIYMGKFVNGKYKMEPDTNGNRRTVPPQNTKPTPPAKAKPQPPSAEQQTMASPPEKKKASPKTSNTVSKVAPVKNDLDALGRILYFRYGKNREAKLESISRIVNKEVTDANQLTPDEMSICLETYTLLSNIEAELEQYHGTTDPEAVLCAINAIQTTTQQKVVESVDELLIVDLRRIFTVLLEQRPQ